MSRTQEHESNEAHSRGGLTSSSCEGAVMALEPRGQRGTGKERQQEWKSAPEQQKPYAISQEEVSLAWQRVRAKGRMGGVDGEDLRSFEERLSRNLYKLWNRISSGSYHPQAALRVYIPKGGRDDATVGHTNDSGPRGTRSGACAI